MTAGSYLSSLWVRWNQIRPIPSSPKGVFLFKLIASDMDGTLLDENGQVPPETYELILTLCEHGVHFAASSGRRYDSLCEFFCTRSRQDGLCRS